MKNILKSIVTIGALAAMLTVSTGAWFTSSVTAQDNVINTGTLLVAVDSAQEDTYVGTWGAPNAFNVVEQLANGTVVQNGNFITWDNAAPGDINTYTVGVRNAGSIAFKFRAGATGAWVSGPRFGTLGCPVDAASADHSLVSVTNIHQYAVTAGGGCEGDFGCRNLRDGLQTGPWTPATGLTAGDSGAVTGFYYGVNEGNGNVGGTPSQIGAGQFAIYQVEAELSNTADSCYQGATYHFDLGVEATQVAAPF